ncbi:sulfite exporter TauE/SafE family protein [Rhodovarius crocodyli]|uniref:Probable membrane transporter protein n=1 Tax=Rhodovarius crocodyli TaxID=1979269 RepID=A0A437MND5_9PROT|nr:sulfite exporter TauE/SafE family protein [Rhodovarius crocodyli]RVT99161.1 sulfite exporter TauE/SafE family protein [Rhodovarius crocodyli]
MDAVALAACLAIAGAAGGFLAGLFGLGVGVVLVPVMTALPLMPGVTEGNRMPVALAVSLAVTVPTSALAMAAHARRGSLNMPLLKRLAPGMLAGVLLGCWGAVTLPASVLQAVFGLVALLVGLWLGLAGPQSRLADSLPGEPARAALAAVVGAISAMMGVGGGTLGVPALVLFGTNIGEAVALGSGFGVLIAAPATLTLIWAGWGASGTPLYGLGYLDLAAMVVVLPLALLATPIGARAAHRLPPMVLRKGFAGLMALLGVKMLWAAFF